MKLGFIGCGNMATAIAKGVTKSNIFTIDALIATDIIEQARLNFTQTTQIQTTAEIEDVLKAEFIIIAIKPQQFEEFLTIYAKKIPRTTTVISIAAGKKVAWIQSFFEAGQPIVRIMPNLNATIGQAVSALTKNEFVSEQQHQVVSSIVTSFGTLHCLEESQFSTFTAIAGSSPAYFFKMIEAMSVSAQQNGIDYNIAKQIIIDTMIGSASFANTSDTPLPTLIKNVTSPKGTTEAALTVLNQRQFDEIIDQAQIACIQRDIELGKE